MFITFTMNSLTITEPAYIMYFLKSVLSLSYKFIKSIVLFVIFLICSIYKWIKGTEDLNISNKLNEKLINPNYQPEGTGHIGVYHNLDKIIEIINNNEAFLLFPNIDPIDFMKFVDMYCIFQKTENIRISDGHNICGYEKHGIKYIESNNKLSYNHICFYENINKYDARNTSGSVFHINLNINKIDAFRNFISYYDGGSKWVSLIILSYLSLRYMYNYHNGILIEKNKRYIHINTYNGFQHYKMNELKYKYKIGQDYLNKYTIGNKSLIIHEVYEFEKWW